MRYSNMTILLHWLGAGLIFLTFGVGAWGLVPTPNTAHKLPLLWLHMGLGLSLLVLTALRLMLRARRGGPRLKRPTRTAARPGRPQPWLTRLAQPVQNLLYAATPLMALSGLGLAWQAGYGQDLRALPADFYAFSLRAAHGTFSSLLAALIVLHLLTWAYYQFIRGENALAWMWFRKPKKDEHE